MENDLTDILAKNKLFERMLNNMTDIIYIYNIVEGRNVYSNNQTISMLGYSTEEIESFGEQLLVKLMHPDDYQYYLTNTYPRYALLQDDSVLLHQYRLKHKNGTWRWMNCKERIFARNDKHEPIEVFGIIEDITEEKQIKEKVKHQQDRIARIIDASNTGLWEWNTAEDTVYYSSRWKALLGYEDEELENGFSTWLNNLHPDDRDRMMTNVNEFIANPVGNFEHEFRMRHKQGHYVWILNRSSATLDKNGKVVYMSGSHLDITDLKLALDNVDQSQNALNASENKFKVLFESTPLSLCHVDNEGNFVLINDRFTTLFGYDLNDVPSIDQWWVKAYPDPEYRKWVLETWNECVDTARANNEDILSIEYEVSCKNGDKRIVLIGGITFDDGLLATLIDVTERIASEKALIESEKKFKQIFNSINESICIIDTNQHIVDVNEAMCIQHGYTKDEFLGLPPLKLITKEYWPEVNQFMSELKTEDKFEGETINVRKDGTIFYSFIQGSKVQVNGAPYLLASITDITNRKKTEQRIIDSERKFHTLYDHSPDMHVSVSPITAQIIECNTTLEKETGYSRDELIGMPIFDMYHESNIDEVKSSFQCFVDLGEVKNTELILKRKDGSKMDVSLNVNSVRDENGKILYSMSSWRDVTEKKIAEKELQKAYNELERSNEELEQFAYVSSHDLQEPLRKVKNYAELLEKRFSDQLDEKAHRYIEIITRGAGRMQVLIDDLLTISRVTTRGQDFEPVDMSKVIDESIDNLEIHIQNVNAKIQYHKMPVVKGDSRQLVLLMQNLISNAIKFKTSTDPVVQISAKQEKGNWLFIVKDNGIGFDMQFADRIFTVFQRLHTREEYDGTGIGLAICRKIIERHRGKIWATSIEGEGARFCFTIPKL